jgi:hypothetical protein
MTLATYRCLPEGGHYRPRPAVPLRSVPDGPGGPAPAGPRAAVDAYGRPTGRPPWLAGEYLALLERQGRGVGVIYLLHFDRPIGDLHNPRGFASHYTLDAGPARPPGRPRRRPRRSADAGRWRAGHRLAAGPHLDRHPGP